MTNYYPIERAIRDVLAAYLDAHPESAGRSRRKARASQLNGRLGGRPRKTA